MRILFLTHRIPYPPNKGDKIRSYHILKYLSKNHEVYLGTLIDDCVDMRFVEFLQPLVRECVFDRVNPKLKRFTSLVSILKSQPISTSYFYSTPLQRAVDSVLDRSQVDVVFCYSSPMAEYLFRSRHRKGCLQNSTRVMDFIDVDSFKWAQYAERSSGWKRLVYRYESVRLSDYEQRIVETFDSLMVVSEQEKKILSRGLLVKNLHALPNGVDVDYFNPKHPSLRIEEAPTLVFTGAMDYWPNIEGVAWFVENVLPRVQEAVPGCVFYIVGARPTAEVIRLKRFNGVKVTGYVEDIRDYLSGADVCVAPLRIARGIQNKVLEAMAMSKPVVGTVDALEGIVAKPGVHVVQAGNEIEFAEAVIHLLRHPEERCVIGEKARRCVERHYSWERNLGALEYILRPCPPRELR
jgi:polysaccharide biosynthesis protein PslH